MRIRLIFLIVGLLFISGCEIEESQSPDTGGIYVTAENTDGSPVVGGKIYLDGLEQGVSTPDTVKNVDVGEHSLKVKAEGYAASEDSVTVYKGEITVKNFVLEVADYGFLEWSISPGDGMLILDLIAREDAESPLQVETGLHTVSAFLNGFRTASPALDSVWLLTPEGTEAVAFTLEQGVLGSTAGTVAYDFTLEDDFGNMVSLHNYRGYIVVLSFFYKNCQPCMEEFPDINQAFIDFSEYGVQVLGIDPMSPDDLEDVQYVRESLGLQFKLLLDYGYTVNLQYGVSLYPTNIVISPSGEIHSRFNSTDYAELTEIFGEILGL